MQDQGRAVARHGSADGLQAGDGCRKILAPAERRKPVAQGHPRRHIPQRRRGHQHAREDRRLISASPKSRIARKKGDRASLTFYPLLCHWLYLVQVGRGRTSLVWL